MWHASADSFVHSARCNLALWVGCGSADVADVGSPCPKPLRNFYVAQERSGEYVVWPLDAVDGTVDPTLAGVPYGGSLTRLPPVFRAYASIHRLSAPWPLRAAMAPRSPVAVVPPWPFGAAPEPIAG